MITVHVTPLIVRPDAGEQVKHAVKVHFISNPAAAQDVILTQMDGMVEGLKPGSVLDWIAKTETPVVAGLNVPHIVVDGAGYHSLLTHLLEAQEGPTA